MIGTSGQTSCRWRKGHGGLRLDQTKRLNKIERESTRFRKLVARVAIWPLMVNLGLIKIGTKVVRHRGYLTFQMAEVAVSRGLFAEILGLIGRLRPFPTRWERG